MNIAPESFPSAAKRGVLFDLDGTLIDHFETLYRCYEYTLGRLQHPVPTREFVRRSVGGSMEVTMRHFLPEAQIPAAARIWREHLERIFLDDVKLMPGARELVPALHATGRRLGVFTNKLGETSRGIMRHLALERWLVLVLGANDTPYRKPQREFSQLALERLGTTAAETLLVGDSPFDVEAARSVGMRCACVNTGTHTTAELRAAGADAVYDDLTTLGAAEFGPIRAANDPSG